MSDALNHKEELILESQVGTEVIINGRKLLYFAGVGYYQLQSHPKVIEAGIVATRKYGMTSATSRSINGTTELLQELEAALAQFFGSEQAVYLPSGYLSNMAGLEVLKEQKGLTHIFIDEHAHYCLKEAAKLCQLPLETFRHCRVEDLEQQLQRLGNNNKPLILSDGMFPVWGHLAPVRKYLKLVDEYNGVVWIDDAHSVGVNGVTGKGTYEHFNISSPRLFMGATLSKAFGAYGGFVTGTNAFISALKESHVVKGTTALLNAGIGAALEGIKQLKKHPEWRVQLWNNARYLKSQLKNIGINIEVNIIPVATFDIKDAVFMQDLQTKLMNKGIYIQYLKYIGAGEEGVLRIVVFSTHTKEQIDFLITELSKVLV